MTRQRALFIGIYNLKTTRAFISMLIKSCGSKQKSFFIEIFIHLGALMDYCYTKLLDKLRAKSTMIKTGSVIYNTGEYNKILNIKEKMRKKINKEDNCLPFI